MGWQWEDCIHSSKKKFCNMGLDECEPLICNRYEEKEHTTDKITRTLYWISSAMMVKCNGYTDYLFTTNLDTWKVYNTGFRTEDVEGIFISKEDIEIILKEGYYAKQ